MRMWQQRHEAQESDEGEEGCAQEEGGLILS